MRLEVKFLRFGKFCPLVISMLTQGVLVQFGQLDPQSEMEIVPLFEMLGVHHNLGITHYGFVFDYRHRVKSIFTDIKNLHI